MKNILLTGFFGEGNLGDEAILQAICESLPKDIIPIITSGSFHSYGKDIKRKGLLSWPFFLKAAYNSPITLFTGGILQDWSWEGVTFFAYRILAAAKMGSMPVLYGAGIGPLRSEKAKKLVRKALSFVKIAYVRDRTSYVLYKSLLPHANVKLGTDWTWHFPINNRGNRNYTKLGINLRQWNVKDLLVDAIKEIESFDCEKIGLAARKSDINIIKNNPDLLEVKCPENFETYAQDCANLSHGISMRFHSALAMLRTGLETKLVCYDDKVKDLAKSAGMIINTNNITQGYKRASDIFFATNEARFQEMNDSFSELINRVYHN